MWRVSFSFFLYVVGVRTLECLYCFVFLVYEFGSRVIPSIFGLMFMGSVVLFICSVSCVLQPTSGGAVTADKNCCANCVEPSRPQQWGPDLPFFGHAGHADPLDGWRCCSQKRVMSRPIQVRQH